MNNQPVKTLKRLIQQHGPELASDSRRTEALLNDHCPSFRTEVFVLVNAQRQQVPSALLAVPEWMPTDAAVERISRRLQERLALSAEASDWAVRSWGVALGLQPNPTLAAQVLDRACNILKQVGKAQRGLGQKGQSGSTDVQSSPRRTTPEGLKAAHLQPDAEQLPAATQGTASDSCPSAYAQRTPTGLQSYARIMAAVLSMAVIWILVAEMSYWETPGFVIGQARSKSRVAVIEYALPRPAEVSDGPLMVRVGAGMDQDSITTLPAGQSVRVTAFSEDMQWSRISKPVDGWVSNWYLHFDTPDDPHQKVRLLYQEMTAAADDATVYERADARSSIATLLPAGEPVVTVAVTTDGQWRQVVRPERGWTLAQDLVPN